MTPPRNYRASPLPSYAVRPGYSARPVSFVEALSAIKAWLVGKRPSFREQVREAKLVERLAEELAEQKRGRW